MCKLARSAGAIDDPGDRAEIEIYERDAVEVLGHGRTPSKRKFVVQATLTIHVRYKHRVLHVGERGVVCGGQCYGSLKGYVQT